MLDKVFTYEQLETIKTEDNLLQKALMIVKILFKDKVDKENKPYINHLYFVRDNVELYEEKIVGLLHDTVEDTLITFSDLKDLGFPQNIINSLKLLTRSKNISYLDYIDNIIQSNDLVAIRVKNADMKHNMDSNRMMNLDIKDRERLMKKYKGPYEKIKNYLERRDKYDRY